MPSPTERSVCLASGDRIVIARDAAGVVVTIHSVFLAVSRRATPAEARELADLLHEAADDAPG